MNGLLVLLGIMAVLQGVALIGRLVNLWDRLKR